jgi:hypothetical protein
MEKKPTNKSSSSSPFNRSAESSRWTPRSSETATKPSATLEKACPPTHAEIAERAKAVWKAHGSQSGRDRENWLEAESQLRKERGCL